MGDATLQRYTRNTLIESLWLRAHTHESRTRTRKCLYEGRRVITFLG